MTLDDLERLHRIYTVFQKRHPFYFCDCIVKRWPILADRCNVIAMSGCCHDMLSACLFVVCGASVL